MRSIIICIMNCAISMRFSIIGWRVAKGTRSWLRA